MSGRLLRMIGAATLLVALSAGAAVAGGWATITADTDNPDPTEGVAMTFGFTVLQHGQTPAGWESPRFVAINSATGERVEADAVGQGPDGHFVATVTIPSAGYWTWQVELRDLLVETAPQALVVAAANGSVPAVSGAEMVAAMERIRTEVRTEIRDEFYAELDTIRSSLSTQQGQINLLRSERDALREQVAALEAAPAEGVPIIAVVAIGALAGAIAGFAMFALGRATAGTGGAVEERAPSSAGTQPVG